MNDQLRKYKQRKQSTGQKDIRFFVEVFPLDPKASLSRALKVTPLKRGLLQLVALESFVVSVKNYPAQSARSVPLSSGRVMPALMQ